MNFQLIVHYIENYTNQLSTLDNLYTMQQGGDTVTMVSSSGQVIATGLMMTPALMPLSILANGAVAYVQTAKIYGDVANPNAAVNVNDVITIVGAASGIAFVATVALPSAAVAATTFSAIAISASFASVWNSTNVDVIKAHLANIWSSVWNISPETNFSSLYISPAGTLATRHEIYANWGDAVFYFHAPSPGDILSAGSVNFALAYSPYAHWDANNDPVGNGAPLGDTSGPGYYDPWSPSYPWGPGDCDSPYCEPWDETSNTCYGSRYC